MTPRWKFSDLIKSSSPQILTVFVMHIIIHRPLTVLGFHGLHRVYGFTYTHMDPCCIVHVDVTNFDFVEIGRYTLFRWGLHVTVGNLAWCG